MMAFEEQKDAILIEESDSRFFACFFLRHQRI